MNTTADLVIVGDGLVPCLIALAFARLRPNLAVLLITPSLRNFGGTALEICVDSQIPPALVPVIEPLIVKLWPMVKIVLPDRSIMHSEPAYLIDPAQIELEVVQNLPAHAIIRGAQIDALSDRSVRISGRTIVAAAVLDLRDRTRVFGPGFIERSEMVGWDGIADLDAPVFADYSFAGLSRWTYLQQVPLGGDRLWMRFIGEQPGGTDIADDNLAATPPMVRPAADLIPPTPLSAALQLCNTLIATSLSTRAMAQKCNEQAAYWQRAMAAIRSLAVEQSA